ncbi:hypothetical protein L596_001535 [Steinernema carpocapsae]|uniref:Uncharacterized protein n=1 Tax=Steinernema carpocapsae TaxID=34508 RepID=A0A4U8ULI3_STECR|nr:hypothetical protein L596_001535 [Steinernema carpocapsae]
MRPCWLLGLGLVAFAASSSASFASIIHVSDIEFNKNTTDFPYLPTHVVPKSYYIYLNVSLKTFSYDGCVSIDVEVLEETNLIKLHSDVAKIKHVLVSNPTPNGNNPVQFSFLTTTFIKNPVPPGLLNIEIVFRGEISTEDLTGIHASFYDVHWNRQKSEFMVVTQFEPTGARRAFPCFDEPSFKAMSQKPLFRRTPVRACTRPGESSKARVSLDATVAALDYFTDLFGIENGIRKVDVLAVPQFSAGGMENWGLITARHSVLVPKMTPLSIRKKYLLNSLMSHEVGHFWFGNLVTMKWWDQLWLKEAFATYFSKSLFSFQVNPQEKSEALSFMVGVQTTALYQDGYLNSTSIQRPVHKPDQLLDMYNLATYEKGAAVLRMIHDYIKSKNPNKDLFLKAMRIYLKRHQGDSVEAGDFWNVFQEAAGENIGALFFEWFKKPGFPLVTVSLASLGFADLMTLKQERFLWSYQKNENATTWNIPIEICQISEMTPELSNCAQKMLTAAKAGDLVQNDMTSFHVVRSGHYNLDRLLKTIAKFKNEHSYLMKRTVAHSDHYAKDLQKKQRKTYDDFDQNGNKIEYL